MERGHKALCQTWFPLNSKWNGCGTWKPMMMTSVPGHEKITKWQIYGTRTNTCRRPLWVALTLEGEEPKHAIQQAHDIVWTPKPDTQARGEWHDGQIDRELADDVALRLCRACPERLDILAGWNSLVSSRPCCGPWSRAREGTSGIWLCGEAEWSITQ